MILTNYEQQQAMEQLIYAVNSSPSLKREIQMFIWNMLEGLDSIYKREERFGDI